MPGPSPLARLGGASAAPDDPNLELHAAVEAGDASAVRRALRHGADPNHESPAGTSARPVPLALAAYQGDRRVCQALIGAGASVSPRFQVVEAALAGGHIALAELLRLAGEEAALRAARQHTQGPGAGAASSSSPQAAAEPASRHEAAVMERRERLNLLEEEEERRARGEKLAHQMAVMVERQLSEAQLQAERHAAKLAKAERLEAYGRRRQALAEDKAEYFRQRLQKTVARHAAERRVEQWQASSSQLSRRRTYAEWRARMDTKEVRPPPPVPPPSPHHPIWTPRR